ncbi:MAG: HAD hydrolase-like protein [Oscillospiraceae bacterium]|nr:HAD hydrolase-like protein [Oscillospiraceae bacterium]
MKYSCLILDHDDTVVNSTATVHYPCFVEYTRQFFPHVNYSLEDYFRLNFDPGIVTLFRSIGLDDKMMLEEQEYWNAYVQRHVPRSYEGIRELLWAQKNAGVKLCVISHSYGDNILRDYRENGLPEPDMVFGWECPPSERKPSPHPVFEILRHYGLKPGEVLAIDDLKPGYDMAMAAGIPFAAAGWANNIPEIESFMRSNCEHYFKTVSQFREHLEGK